MESRGSDTEFDDGGEVTWTNSWNVDELVTFLSDELPKSAQVQLARTARVRSVQKRLANKIVKTATLATGGIGAAGLPIADIRRRLEKSPAAARPRLPKSGAIPRK